MTRFTRIVLLIAMCSVGYGDAASGQDLVSNIVKGGITADGDVVGAPTDFLINLNVPLDNSNGLSLAAGNTVQIILPPEFVDTGTLSVDTAFSSKTCTPGALECNTSAFIQGWPQRPIVNAVPPVTGGSENTTGNPVYTFSLESGDDGTHTFTHTAVMDVGPGSAPPGPGIKQIHMILPGFQNPTTAGDYEIQVVAQTGPDGAEQIGKANLTVRPSVAPSVNLTTIYDPARRNQVYQEVQPGDDIAPYDFWLWDANGAPYLDVEVVGDELQKNGEVVGQISISGPEGAMGQSLTSSGPSTPATEVFFNQDTARLSTQFVPGDLLGEYVTTIEMLGGNSQRMVVNIVPEPSAVVLVLIAALCMSLRGRTRKVSEAMSGGC